MLVTLVAVLALAVDGGPLAARLIEASRRGDLTDARRLLAQGADPSAADTNAETPLCVAAEAGHLDVLEALFEKASAMPNCARGELLMYAARSDVAAVVRLVALHQQVALYPYRVHAVASFAAREGKEPVLLAMLSAGADINAIDRELAPTALHRLAKDGHASGVELLLRNGADPTLALNKLTPADVARTAGHAAIAGTLAAAAADWRTARAKEAADAYLTAPRFSTLEALDGIALALLRNEIFARHGQRFLRATFSKVFELRPWYRAGATAVAEDALTNTERAVLAKIRAREKTLGGPQRFE